MGISLITIVGRGKIGDGSYVKTRYTFPDGYVSGENTIFSKALMERYKDNLDSIVIVGTETSSWSAILPDDCGDEEYTEFLLHLFQCEEQNRPISEEDLSRVREKLQEIYPSRIHILPPQKSDISEEENALAIYSNVFSYLKKGSKIVFDITSGFRYIPLLIFQNLQVHSPDISLDDVTLYYAELNGNTAVVRDVSSVWKAAEINKALSTFKYTLNGLSLSVYLAKQGYKNLADWIYEFSENIQKSYIAICDRSFFARLNNILKNIDIRKIENAFIKETLLFLKEEINSKFNYDPNLNRYNQRSCFLFTFAEILNDKGLFIQAMVALRESLLIRLYENHDREQIGKYLSEEALSRKDYYHAFEDNCNKSLKEKINQLKKVRNLSAHAGIELISNQEQRNISRDFKIYHDAVKTVFWSIEPCR